MDQRCKFHARKSTPQAAANAWRRPFSKPLTSQIVKPNWHFSRAIFPMQIEMEDAAQNRRHGQIEPIGGGVVT